MTQLTDEEEEEKKKSVACTNYKGRGVNLNTVTAVRWEDGAVLHNCYIVTEGCNKFLWKKESEFVNAALLTCLKSSASVQLKVN